MRKSLKGNGLDVFWQRILLTAQLCQVVCFVGQGNRWHSYVLLIGSQVNFFRRNRIEAEKLRLEAHDGPVRVGTHSRELHVVVERIQVMPVFNVCFTHVGADVKVLPLTNVCEITSVIVEGVYGSPGVLVRVDGSSRSMAGYLDNGDPLQCEG